MIEYSRQPFTGGVRPREGKTAEQQRSAELLRVIVNRVVQESYCQLKEEFAPLPSFKKKLNEQYTILEERAKRLNDTIESEA